MTPKPARRALGRGLSNLIPTGDDQKKPENGIEEIEIGALLTNPFQPRQIFNEEEIRELAESIKSQGLLQPVVVRRKGVNFEIISGERRVRAIKSLGETHVPCIIKENISDTKMLEMALVENIQRENLNDIEVAHSYQRLLQQCGLSHQELSERVGRSRSLITNTLRLLKLPEHIQEMVATNAITSGHARALVSIEDVKVRDVIAQKIVSDGLSVRDVEKLVQGGEKRKGKAQAHGTSHSSSDPDTLAQQERLRYRFGTDVRIVTQNDETGKIEIHFFSREDLNRVLGILLP
jgi:ParB family chromosome partitioning protein